VKNVSYSRSNIVHARVCVCVCVFWGGDNHTEITILEIEIFLPF
jgi:hypothetical protein